MAAIEQVLFFPEPVTTERVKDELEIAKNLQQSLIPEAIPNGVAFEIETFFEPSREVGGDFYDYYILDENRLALMIGDVSGKGIPAAVHMAEIKDIFKTLHISGLEPQEIIFQANKSISACFEKNVFVSMVYVVIDRNRGTFTYIRAGHCPLLFYSRQSAQTTFLQDEGLGLGIIRKDTFGQYIFVYEKRYAAGDVLVLFTDGLDEGQHPKTMIPFGYKGVRMGLEKAIKNKAKDIRKVIISDFKKHVKKNDDLDDLAMIVVKFR